ncbi:MAG: DUF1992 domain-containing protein [Chloroflexi bacterium]|nr:DUF1992 domain-containing protein [Chloroflexota bacterium]
MDRQQRPRRGPPPPRGTPWEPMDEPLRRWESLIERQIREARDAGAFDDLPYQGEPLPPIDDAYAGEQAAAFRILRSAGVAPGLDRGRQGGSRARGGARPTVRAGNENLAAHAEPGTRSARADRARTQPGRRAPESRGTHRAPTPPALRPPGGPCAPVRHLESCR